MRKLISSLLTLTLLAVPLAITSQVQAQTLPPAATIYSSVSVYVDDVNFVTLHDFITDLDNDILWFPGIVSTELIVDGNKPGAIGNQYYQIADFGGITTYTTIDVISEVRPFTFLIEGSSAISEYTAFYVVTPQHNGGAVFTLNSVYTAPGLTEETFSGLISYALGGLLTHYNSAGHVEANFVYATN